MSKTSSKAKKDKINCKVGLNIKNFRLSRGKSRVTVAKTLNISFQQLAKYEDGKSNITAVMLTDIANYFKVPIEELFGQPTIKHLTRSHNMKILECAKILSNTSEEKLAILREIIKLFSKAMEDSTG